MIKVRFKRNIYSTNQPVYLEGEVYEMTNNEAFGFIEKGYAEAVRKGLDKPVADKQVKRGRKKINLKVK